MIDRIDSVSNDWINYEVSALQANASCYQQLCVGIYSAIQRKCRQYSAGPQPLQHIWVQIQKHPHLDPIKRSLNYV